MSNQKLPRGIRQRGDRFFVDVTMNGQRKTATCDTLEKAVETQAELKLSLMTGKVVEGTRSNARTWTLQEALDKTLKMPKPEGWRGTSYEKQATLNVEDAIAYMGPQRKLDTITRDLIDAWLDTCEAKGNSDSTINRKVSSLSKVMKVAINYGGLAQMPRMPRQRKERVSRIRQLTAQEEATLAAHLRNMGKDDMADAVEVLVDTGVRCGELWNVRWTDVDLKQKVMLVYGNEGKGTKNGRVRSVPLTSRAAAILGRRRKAGEPKPFDFRNSDLRHAWDRCRALMGLSEDKDFVPHVLRHTCASRLVKAGVSLLIVQQWLGHTNIQTTMRYAHLFPQDLMNAAAALERNS